MRRPARPHRGFTLLEVVIATGLGIFLASAIYSVVAMHYAQTEIGRTIADDAQALRGLAKRFREDLWNTAFEWTPPTPPGSASSASGTAGTSGTGAPTAGTSGASSSAPASGAAGAAANGGAAASATASSTADESANANNFPGGIAGDEASLTIATRRMSRDLDFSGAGGATQTLRTVQYRVGTPQDGGPDGLVREEFDRTPDLTGGDPLRSETLSPEVEAIAFRYYDGNGWVSTWDSTQTKAPYAVEATMTVRLRRRTAAFPDGKRKLVVLTALPGADLPAAQSSTTGGA